LEIWKVKRGNPRSPWNWRIGDWRERKRKEKMRESFFGFLSEIDAIGGEREKEK
jgi:hypothetical protein